MLSDIDVHVVYLFSVYEWRHGRVPTAVQRPIFDYGYDDDIKDDAETEEGEIDFGDELDTAGDEIDFDDFEVVSDDTGWLSNVTLT